MRLPNSACSRRGNRSSVTGNRFSVTAGNFLLPQIAPKWPAESGFTLDTPGNDPVMDCGNRSNRLFTECRTLAQIAHFLSFRTCKNLENSQRSTLSKKTVTSVTCPKWEANRP